MSVYFATCREANAVKIGNSVDPHGRLPEIQIGCPLTITIEAILPGGCEEEFRFHRWFADDRIRGEWFAINEMIELIIANNPVSQAPAKTGRTIRCERPQKLPKQRVPLGINDRLDRKRYAAAMLEMRAAREAAQ